MKNMNEISLVNSNNQIFTAEVIRYYHSDNNYLIFSLNEHENDLTKLYATKIINYENRLVGTVPTNDEWETIKRDIKLIASNNQNNIENKNDLSFEKLNNLLIKHCKVFKLKTTMVEVLAKNKLLKKDDNIDYKDTIEEYNSRLKLVEKENKELREKIEAIMKIVNG